MVNFILFSIIIVLLMNKFTLNLRVGGRVSNFDRFDGYCEEKYMPPGKGRIPAMAIKNGAIKLIGRKFYVSYDMDVKEDINHKMKFHLYIERCKSKESLDTCEKFFNYKLDDYCDVFKGMLGDFILNFEPHFDCPPKKGLYRCKNATFDSRAFLLFPSGNWYWRVRGTLDDTVTGVRLMCTNVNAWTYSS